MPRRVSTNLRSNGRCGLHESSPTTGLEVQKVTKAYVVKQKLPYSRGSTRLRKERAAKWSARLCRWVSHASHTFSRSGECSLGLFHTTAQLASVRHFLAEHTWPSSDSFMASVSQAATMG